MSIQVVLAFLAVAILAYVTPGPDWFVVMRHAAASRRAGLAAACGVQCGLLVHITAAAVGVAAVVLASATAFTVLKWLGAAYLVVLGVRALRDSTARSRQIAQEQGGAPPASLSAVWRQAFVANVMNPKAALFFVAVLPQFVTPGTPLAVQVIVLGLLDVVLGVVWWLIFVVGIDRVAGLLGAARSRVVIDRVSGVALIGLGGLLAISGRRLAT